MTINGRVQMLFEVNPDCWLIRNSGLVAGVGSMASVGIEAKIAFDTRALGNEPEETIFAGRIPFTGAGLTTVKPDSLASSRGEVSDKDASELATEARPTAAIRGPMSAMRCNAEKGKCDTPKPWSRTDYETILPVQYYENLSSGQARSSERKLLLALLEDALRSYVRTKKSLSGARRMEFVDTRTWFNERGASHLFSFESVCANLDLDPEFLRDRLNSLVPADFPRKQLRTRRRSSRHPFRINRSSIPERSTEASADN
jgi:hypothetical protein